MKTDNKLKQLIEYYLGLGCSNFQAKRRAKLVYKWDKQTELSTGMIYKEMRSLGIDQLNSFEIETKFWILYDKVNPPTPYEKGYTNFVEGRSKLKYNQIPLIN